MVTDNGIDWLIVLADLWPCITWAAGCVVGGALARHFVRDHLAAQDRELRRLRQLNLQLASDNERIIVYTNYLIDEERNGKVS